MTTDLNVADHPYDEPYDGPDGDFLLVAPHKIYRDDILRTLAYRVDLRKLEPGIPNEHFKYLVGRVRLTKSCGYTIWHEDFGGTESWDRCTADGTFRVIFDDRHYYDGDTEGELVCAHHMDELHDQERTYGNVLHNVILPSNGGTMPALTYTHGAVLTH